ncbi:MAG: putative glycolipid-binding domain-containing protein [Streptomyces sp.]|uniref:putative glycolipid-binding domain-containing protein n=1 Tax=Streptomyces sp. TaxID=1931 RepID=UPI003D6A2783
MEADRSWTTRGARISGRSAAGSRTTTLTADGAGHWRIDGEAAAHLDGCRDADLESSAMTNAFPVRRMRLAAGARAEAPAAYVRAADLAVERLEQTYERVTDEAGQQHYDYAAPVFDFACRLVYDNSGLALAYPGIATRVT